MGGILYTAEWYSLSTHRISHSSLETQAMLPTRWNIINGVETNYEVLHTLISERSLLASILPCQGGNVKPFYRYRICGYD